MGLMQYFRRQPQIKAALPDPSPPTDERWVEVTVRNVEELVAKYRNWSNSHQLSAYAQHLALDAALFNAKNLAAVPLRLYRRAQGSGVLNARKVTKARMRHLTDPDAVGRKAATMADLAGDVVEITDAPPLSVLRRPDPRSTGTAWDVARWVSKQLYGEALLLNTRAGNLVRLMNQYTKVQPDEGGFITGWYYGRDSHDLAEYKAESILQMKWCEHPSNPYTGLGWLELAIREIEIDDHALASELRRWRQGGYPDAVLSFDAIKTKDQLSEAMRELARQLKQRLGFLVTGEARIQPLALPKDMQYQQGVEMAERRILNRAGIPESLYKLNDANLASSTTGHEAYAKYTLASALAIDAEQWTELLLPRFDLDPDVYFFAYDEVSERDRAEDVSTAVSLVGARIWTRNEARAHLDYAPVPGGDEFDPVPSQMPPAGPSFSLTQSLPTLGAAAQSEPAGLLRAPAKQAAPPEPIKIKTWGKVDPWACCGHDHATKDDDRLPDSAVREFERLMRQYFGEAADQITIAAIANGTADLSRLNGQLADALEPLIAESVRVGGIQGYQQVGVDADFFDTAPEEAVRIVRERGQLVADLVGSTTEEAVREAIAQGVEQQLTAREIQERVQAALGESAPHRAETIARTETANAMEAGSTAAWVDAGVEKNRWLLAPDACSICVALVERLGRQGRESSSVPINEPFIKRGETLVGADGRTFTAAYDVYHAPLHPNDRCTTVPVLPEAE